MTPTHSPDGDIIREEAASIPALQVPVDAAVDVSYAPNASTRTQLGVSDRSTQRTSSCLRLSMGPQQICGAALRAQMDILLFEGMTAEQSLALATQKVNGAPAAERWEEVFRLFISVVVPALGAATGGHPPQAAAGRPRAGLRGYGWRPPHRPSRLDKM
jgi:hypothetical protein